MTNQIIKAIVFDKSIRLFLVDNTKALQEILSLSKIKNKVCCLALAKAVSAMSLLSAILKENQRISSVMTLTNKKHKIYTDIDWNGNVSGYVSEALFKEYHRPHYTGKSLQELIGQNATIRMMKAMGMSQFTGITNMPYQNIDEDIAHYFKQSEQTDTIIQTNIEFNSNTHLTQSYGICSKALPGAKREALDTIQKQFEVKNTLIPRLLSMDNTEAEKELQQFFGRSKVVDRKPIQFACSCSKEMFYGFLYSLNIKELQQTLETNIPIETRCHICNKKYSFDSSEIEEILQ